MHSPLSEAPADPPDEQLVSLAQGGDRRTLEQLVGRHGPWIFHVAARMVWRRDDAADVTQKGDCLDGSSGRPLVTTRWYARFR